MDMVLLYTGDWIAFSVMTISGPLLFFGGLARAQVSRLVCHEQLNRVVREMCGGHD